jgi:Cd2+/Zn2+-exporting ATPase
LVWAFTQDLQRVISVFIVSSPVAFILATPTAMVAAVATASRLGILIKQVSDIELAARINAFIFDKTGTITTGTLKVSRLSPVDGVKPAELLMTAATAEQFSNHPTAKAIMALAKEAELTLNEPEQFNETAGKGVNAKIDGDELLVGREVWLKENEIGGIDDQAVDLDETQGYSLVYIAKNGKFIGWIGMTDEIRPEASGALEELRFEGVRRLAIVSGDRAPVAERVAAEVGCEEVKADCFPKHKVEYVEAIRQKGYKVAFVGDGVNDAPALKAGDIGIAMGAAGSDVAVNSATIALMNNDLKRLPFLVRLSQSTRTKINQNFVIGILFVIVGLVLASLNLINPVVAAFLNVVGSLAVVFNSARIVREGEEFEIFDEEGEATGSKPEESSEADEPAPKFA